MLSHLKLENFKSWRSADLTFGRITGLFGKNSSGKSSLIQFLLLLKQTRDASDRNVALDLNGPYVELGTMSDVLFRHDGSRGLGFQIGIRSPEPIEIADSSEKRRTLLTSSRELVVSADVASRDNAPVGDMLRYRLGDATFALERDASKRSRFALRAKGVGNFRFVRAMGRKWDLPGPMKTYQFPDQARAYHQNASFLADLEVAFEKSLDGLFYLGPLREWTRCDYLWARSAPTDVGQRGERAISAILAAQDQNWTRNLKPRSKRKKFSEMIA